MADQVLQSPTNPHFFQPLLPGFHSLLNIPLKFYSVHIEGTNERNTVELRSDTCEKTWKVKMDGRRLTLGWKEFAAAHDFRIGDIIVFRHQGDLVFHVTAFGPSCCEIQYVQDKIRNLSIEQNLKTEPEFSPDSSCFVAHITDSNLREDRLFLPRKFVMSDGLKKDSNKIVLMNEGVRTWTLNLKFRESSETFYMNLGWRNFCQENGLKPGDSLAFKLERNDRKTPLLRFSTPESKSVSTKHCSKWKRNSGESSQRRVSSSLKENRFVTLTVTPSSLEACRLYLPVSFTRVHKMEKAGGKKISLLDKHGVEWPVSLPIGKKHTRLWLGSGLKEFLKAIGVKSYESFVLELVWEDSTSPPILKLCSKVKT